MTLTLNHISSINSSEPVKNHLSFSTSLQSFLCKTYSVNICFSTDSPRNTVIVDENGQPLEPQIYPGEMLYCNSDSNPGISVYIWRLTRDNNTESVGDTESVVVHEDWLGDVTLECIVKNEMGENGNVTAEDSAEVSFNVYSKSSI